MKLLGLFIAIGALTAPAALAQKWEVGVAVGGGFYQARDITSPGGTASAKIQSNLSGSVFVDNNRGGHLGGELRYDYQRGDLQLTQGSTKATFGAVSHAMHYDLLWHFTDSESAVRPFVAVGGGVKVFRGNGTEVAFQPLSNIALLTKAQDLTAMASIGAGVKIKLARRLQLRLEVHDYLTPFPQQVITPVQGAKVSGWLQDIVPSVGVVF